MRIGIIGAGNIGSTLARKLVQAGHSVRIANSRGPQTLVSVAEETGAEAASPRDAVQGANVVILSIPFARLPLLKALIAALPDDVVVADTSNYYPVRDGQIPAIDAGQVESLWVSGQIGRRVIKAWNNVLAAVLAGKGLPAGAPGRLALSVAGDDATAKEMVMTLVEDTGFDAIDGGSLGDSWRQQPITGAYCSELTADGLRAALQMADRVRAPQLREEMVKAYIALGDGITGEDIMRLHRAAAAKAASAPDSGELGRRPYTGGCACGAVRYATTQAPVFQNHCQCRDCQRQSGTGHGSYLTFPARSEMKISGKATHWDVAADSGNVKTHAFCPVCGAPVYLCFEAMPDLIAVPAASLDEPDRFAPQVVTYSSRGLAWDAIDSSLAAFERMPVA